MLAALGLYGVMAFAVARRTKEIGLRIALGARQSTVLWIVAREAFAMLGAGFVVGIPCAYALSRFISSQLFAVAPTDLATYIAAVTILGLTAAISSFIPARRASTINPAICIRYE